jgi:predicted Fe-S protein YdhL (DUF1289 family)
LIASPCNKICVMDAKQRYCLGCSRTLAEISAWPSMTRKAQRALLAQLKERRAASTTKITE